MIPNFSSTLLGMLQRIWTPKIRILGALFYDIEQLYDFMHKLALLIYIKYKQLRVAIFFTV